MREALRGLSMMGIVVSRQGGGCYVTDLSASRLMSPLSFYLQLRNHSMEELFRARNLIDSGLASDAAPSGDPDGKTQLPDRARIGHDLAADLSKAELGAHFAGNARRIYRI